MKARDGKHYCTWCGDNLPRGKYGCCSKACSNDLHRDTKRNWDRRVRGKPRPATVHGHGVTQQAS